MIYGTKVKNPARRAHDSWGYSKCSGCGKYFTAFGLPRHWNHCPPARAKREAWLRSTELPSKLTV